MASEDTDSDPQEKRLWSFANVVFDEASWRLSVGGEPVRLEEKPLRLLRILMERPRETVSKSELLDQVWPGVFVVEASLTTAISKLRRALGVDGSDLIETVPRRGYRLNADVAVERCAEVRAGVPWRAGEALPGRAGWHLVEGLDDDNGLEVWSIAHADTSEQRTLKVARTAQAVFVLEREWQVFQRAASKLAEPLPVPEVIAFESSRDEARLEARQGGAALSSQQAVEMIRAMSPAERLQVASTLARALSELHGCDIGHGGLSADDVLLNRDRDLRPVVRIDGCNLLDDDLGGQVRDADCRALGLLTYQIIRADPASGFAPGWEGLLADPVLVSDILAVAPADDTSTPLSAADYALRLDRIEERRADHDERLRTQERERRLQRELEVMRARQPWVRMTAVAAGAAIVFLVGALVVTMQERNQARQSAQLSEASFLFLAEDLLGQSNPLSGTPAEETLLGAARRAQSLIDVRYQSQPRVAAALHLALANAYAMRSDYNAARRAYGMADAAYARAGMQNSDEATRARLVSARFEGLSGQPGSIERASEILEAERTRLGARARRGYEGFLVAQAEGIIRYFSDVEMAAEAFARAIEIAEAGVEGLRDRDLVLVRQQLALSWLRLGRVEDAAGAFRVVIDDWTRLVGPSHASTLIARQNMVTALQMSGDYTATLREAALLMPLLREQMGANSRYTLALHSNRFEALMALGRHEEASVDAEAVWRGAVLSQGAASMQAIVGRTDYGTALCADGRYSQGLVQLGGAYASVESAFGPDHDLSHVVRYYYADCLLMSGRQGEADTLLRGVGKTQVGTFTGEPGWGATLDLALAESALARGDVETARRLNGGLASLGTASSPPYYRLRYQALRSRLES